MTDRADIPGMPMQEPPGGWRPSPPPPAAFDPDGHLVRDLTRMIANGEPHTASHITLARMIVAAGWRPPKPSQSWEREAQAALLVLSKALKADTGLRLRETKIGVPGSLELVAVRETKLGVL